MLNSQTSDDKSYEDIRAGAVAQIALYSKEWTNYNPSDPGITILENLSAFQLLQQTHINTITDKVRSRLLKMAGFDRLPGRTARVLIGSTELRSDNKPVPFNHNGHQKLPSHQRFHAGDYCFETNEELDIVSGGVMAVYLETDGQIKEIEELRPGLPISGFIFGEHPRASDRLYILLKELPRCEEKKSFYLSVKVEEPFQRNPCNSKYPIAFATADWSCYTAAGFVEIECRDGTGVFLRSGEIEIIPGDTVPCIGKVCPQSEGYILTCTLTAVQYDMPPRVMEICGPLFEVFEKDTKAVSYAFTTGEKIEFTNTFEDELHLFVYVMEEGRKAGYYEYMEGKAIVGKGRFYKREDKAGGSIEIQFAGEVLAGMPVKVVCCSRVMMLHRYLGAIYGYEGQEIDVSPFLGIAIDSLELMVQKEYEGAVSCYFMKPEETGEGTFCYIYDSDANILKVLETGDYEGASLYFCSCAIFHGAEGNIRENNNFHPAGSNISGRFQNPSAGKDGRYQESIEEVRQRFAQDMLIPYTAVTREDYEYFVKNVPGLCIHKVKAVMSEEINQVNIAVKPYSLTALPELSVRYKEQIYQYLEGKRLLGTKVEIMDPGYIPLKVRAVIHVKQHYDNAEADIGNLIERELDYCENNKDFGETIYFNQLFREIEALPCVDYIYELAITPIAYMNAVTLMGADLKLKEHCLCYVKEMVLEVGK